MISFVFLLTASFLEAPVHGPSREQTEQIVQYHNQLLQSEDRSSRISRDLKAYAEYEDAHYLLTSWESYWYGLEIKELVAKNLPDGVELIVLASNAAGADEAYRHYRRWLKDSEIRTLVIPGGSGFWARDSLPIPSITKENKLHLTDARYYRYNEPDEEIFRNFESETSKHDYYYEGGNLLADKAGNCFIVNNVRAEKMSDKLFKNHYGCKALHRLPHLAGIGHVDERIKIINDHLALTDTVEYQETLENLGYEVLLLPRAERPFETYVNSLLLKDRIFVPTFDQKSDKDVIRIYESTGLKVIPFPSSEISNGGKGSLHCITMIYPYTPMKDLVEALLVPRKDDR